MVPAKAPKRFEKLQFAPLMGAPQKLPEQVPLIHIGTNRSLREQLPGAWFSVLCQMFQAIDADFPNSAQSVTVRHGHSNLLTSALRIALQSSQVRSVARRESL